MPGQLFTGMTGVDREYRRRGLATGLKVLAIARAREMGYRSIRTFNDSTNAPMLAINRKLGFARKPAWIGFRKTFEGKPE
jgi:RimJ/RimL family protein N-acetyltransferase